MAPISKKQAIATVTAYVMSGNLPYLKPLPGARNGWSGWPEHSNFRNTFDEHAQR